MFGAMAFSAKIASERLSGPQVALVRFTVGLTPLLVPRFRRLAFQFKRVDLLLYRGLFGGTAVLLYFLCIEHTTAGIATLLNYTAPLWSAIFSMLFLGEKISPKVLIPAPIVFLGVILVVKAHASPNELLGFGRWELVGALSAVCSGAAVTAMRAARQGENSWSVYTSFTIFGLLVASPFGITTWKNPTLKESVALAAMALFSIGAQLILTFTLRWVDAMTVGVISQLAVVVAFALGAAFLGEQVVPMSAAGSLITIGGVVGVIYIMSRAKPRAAADEVAPES
jgi:drug/metabolite transporter (DMT)-like permease